MTLIERIQYSLICDICSAHWDGAARVPAAASKADIVIAARRDGWTHLPDCRDICPGCESLAEAGA